VGQILERLAFETTKDSCILDLFFSRLKIPVFLNFAGWELR